MMDRIVRITAGERLQGQAIKDVSKTPSIDPSKGAWFARIFNSLLALGCVAAFGYLWSFPSPHKRTTDKPLKYLCQMQAACIKYRRTRLECATTEKLKYMPTNKNG
jgi:hypothetical protein